MELHEKKEQLEKSLKHAYSKLEEILENGCLSYKIDDRNMILETRYFSPREILRSIEIIESKIELLEKKEFISKYNEEQKRRKER